MSKRRDSQSGFSNVEIDFFLKGKLPEEHDIPEVDEAPKQSAASTPPPATEKNVETTQPLSQQPLKPIVQHKTATAELPDNSHVLRRTKSLSEPEHKKKSGGFFKSLFKSKSKSKNDEPALSRSTSHASHTSTSSTSNSTSHHHISTTRNYENPQPEPEHGHTVSKTRSCYSASGAIGDIDPKLEEFLRYYKAQGLEKLHKDIEEQRPRSNSSAANKPSSKTKKTVKLDSLGRPIPPHPDVAPLPSCLIKTPTFETTLPPGKASSVYSQQLSSSSKMGFFRRHNSTSDSPTSRTASMSSSLNTLAESATSTEKHPVTIPGLDNLPRLKRVAFDIPVFFNDPPQQIPSRTPRKGEVEVFKDGSIVIHKLTAAERKKILSSPGGGLVVGGSGHLKIIANPDEANSDLPDDEGKIRLQNSSNDGSNATANEDDESIASEDSEEDTERAAQQHSIGAAAAAAAAEARAKDAPNDLKRTVTNNEEEVQVSSTASKINIEKPMTRSNKSSASLKVLQKDQEQTEVYPPKNVKIPLDVLYTRCCHLREILPIPATLKQIKAGSTDPIPLLQLRNPKPSLVEVLTFSDFISIAPILCISLDGVSLSEDMFRIILSSLAHKSELEKLTLRNTKLNEYGWKLLCWFLTKSKSITRLDLTQCPSISINVQKPSKTVSNVVRMECNSKNRTDMNWNLFNAAVVSRNGLEELVLNGCHISEREFKDLVEMGIAMKTTRLGLAYNGLTLNQCEVLANSLNYEQIIGLDIGYNDLDGKIKPFLDSIKNGKFKQSQLKFLSLNSTNLSNTNNEIDELLTGLSNLRHLMYLDISNNKKLFPEIMQSITQSLPLYPSLSRFHLDYNDLKQEEIIAFAEIIPFCKSLSYISLVGNAINNVSATALSSALKLSTSVLTLDINYDDVSPKLRETIGLYIVRNMQKQVYGETKSNKKDRNELDGLQQELSNLLLSNDDTLNPQIFTKFLEKALKLRARIRETIDSLFELRLQGKLSNEGKETLIRFCFIDSSIEKGLALLNKKPALHNLHLLDHIEKDRCSPVSLVMSRAPSTTMTSTYVDGQGHTELLPFGVSNQTNADDNHDDLQKLEDSDAEGKEGSPEADDIQPLEDHTGIKAREADDKHLQEEASALKLSTTIKNSEIPKSLSKGDVEALQNLSGESFRQILLNTNDLNNVANVLDSIKEKGISLAKLYDKDNEHTGESYELKRSKAEMEAVSNTAKNSGERKTILSDGEEEDDQHGHHHHHHHGHTDDNSAGADDYDDELSIASDEYSDGSDNSQIYDKVLDHIERVRTNNETA